jgi:hypothetical protein
MVSNDSNGRRIVEEERPSDRMDGAALWGQNLLCPDCGLQGQRTIQVHIGTAIMQMIEGLNLQECEGCRRVLAAQGGVPVGFIDPNRAT